MKKNLFVQLLAAAAFMTSCSSSDESIANDPAPVNGEEIAEKPVAINLGVSNNIATATVRGTGTVGNTDQATNKWDGQHFNVYMFVRNTVTDTIYKNTVFYAGIAEDETVKNFAGDDKEIFNGIDLLPALTHDSVSYIRPKDDLIKYYPAKGAFDFVGYRLDSCWTAAPVNDGSKVTRAFKLTGSQDIMVASAEPAADEVEAIETAAGITNAEARDRFFSSYTARRNYIPTLKFKHLLSRLTFKIIPGTEKAVAANTGIVVDSIKVISKTTGTLVIAPAAQQGIVDWAAIDEANDSLTLMERPAAGASTHRDSLSLKKLTPVSLIGLTSKAADPVNYTKQNIGEALLVAPDAEYKISVFLSQELPVYYSEDPATTTKKHVYEVPATIILPSGSFEAGKSYNIEITVNGVEEIILKAALEHWVEGATIEKDPENEDF